MGSQRQATATALFAASAVLLLASCGGPTRPMPAPRPQTYAATVPCATDCITTAYRITLFPDRSYWYERTLLGANGAMHPGFREVGRFTESAGVLTLKGTLDVPEKWARVTDAALRLQDPSLPANGSALPIAVVLQPEPDRSFGPVRLRGILVHDAAITTLAPCESGTTHAVSGGSGYAELELEYSRAVPRPGAALLVAVMATFVPEVGGTSVIEIEAFERSVAGAVCYP